MAENASDSKIRDFLSKHLSNIAEGAKVRFREIQKAVKSEFGKGMFMPELSAVIHSIRPDLAKKKRGKRGGWRAGAGRPPGPRRGPGRPKGSGRGPGRPRKAAAGGTYLVKLGRKLSLAKSRDRVQAVIDKLVAAGQSLGRLKVYALSQVGVSTRVTID
jgi:hypothetical protein